MLSQEWVRQIREQYPAGTRVRMNFMPNDPQPIAPGTEGEITGCDDAGQLLMRWSNGRSLSLIPGVDDFTVISRPENAERPQDSNANAAPRKRNKEAFR